MGSGGSHHYEYMYHRYLAALARKRCGNGVIRLLEIGLGCGNFGGGNAATGNHSGAGGSVARWLHLFDSSLFRLDYHMMEYDRKCVRQWSSQFPALARRVTMHVGDQSNKADLIRVYEKSGSRPFDAVIDDGSHINDHQHVTMSTFLRSRWVARGGVYIIEDMSAACASFLVNEPLGPGYGRNESRTTAGTHNCLRTTLGRQGTPTMADHLVHYQKLLIRGQLPFFQVHTIAVFEEAAAFEVGREGT